ncbi:MAG: PepSY domain-containing protein [Solirubrobacterales bacterium]
MGSQVKAYVVRRAGLWALAALVAVAAASAVAAPGADASSHLGPLISADLDAPDGYRVSEAEAIEAAGEASKVHKQADDKGELNPTARRKDNVRWEVFFYADGDKVAEVVVDGKTGDVLEQWDGYQVAWKMARGYNGAFGRHVNAPWVWLPLCAIFFFGLLDWRHKLRIVHLDLLVLLGFSISHTFFDLAKVDASVPLVYPVLAYLLARLLWIGVRGRGPALRPSISWPPMAIATVFLLGFRIVLNVLDSNVIDVGYAGVIGADLITSGDQLYGNFPSDNHAGDTYGPLAYLLYVPFVETLGWSGRWDGLPAAHGAAIAFDLLVVAGLLLLGRRLRPGSAGTALGVTLAFAWTAFPYSAFALETNANDSLVAVAIVAVLLTAGSAPARGATAALAAATKFAPLVLLPLLATHREDAAARPFGAWVRARWKGTLAFALAAAVVSAGLYAWPLIDPGPATLWERTVGFQADRGSPFSIWGQWHWEVGQRIAQGLTIALALGLAVWPRVRSRWQLAALMGALLVAVQITLDHWFYLYIVWFLPAVFVALAAPRRCGPELDGGEGPSAVPQAEPHAPTAALPVSPRERAGALVRSMRPGRFRSSRSAPR